MENKNICEEIEIALYSDAKLTDEQKNHIERCENCRALLSQITKMKSDLGAISVPGVEDGQITKAVMERIAKEKASVSFPKFQLTHHLGTAAAVVIILVAVLIMRNPSEPDFENESGENAVTFSAPDENSHVLGAPVINNDSENDTAVSTEEAAAGKETAEADNDDGALVTGTEPENTNTVLRALPKANKNALSQDSENGTSESETATNAPIIYSVYSDTEDTLAPESYADEDTAEEAVEHESIEKSAEEKTSAIPQSESDNVEDEKILMDAPKSTFALGSGSSGGSSGGSSSKDEAVKEADIEETKSQDYDASLQDDAYDTGIYSPVEAESAEAFIFEGIEFSENDDDFENNVSLANARLRQLYGGEYVLSVEKLKELGADNRKLLELAPTITDEMFHFYSGLLDIFE